MLIAEIFERTAGKLPMVPKVIQDLVEIFHHPDLNMDVVANKIGHDQVLAAQVLRLANTARFGGNRKIGTLKDAVVLLGLENLKVLVIASGIAGTHANIPGFDMEAFWQRSFEMATTTQCLAKLARLDAQLGYTCGLLSNIGELMLHVALPNEAIQIDKVVSEGADRVTTERVILGMDLTQVGAELAKRWNFPDTIQEALRNQHNLLTPEIDSPYALLIGLASFIVAGFRSNISQEDMLALLPGSAVKRLGIDVDLLEEAMDELKITNTQLIT